jgi:hypothetical protein
VTIGAGRRSCWLSGKGAVRLVDSLAIPRMWCPTTRLLTIPRWALDDLLALCEDEHVPTVILSGDGWPPAGWGRPTALGRDPSPACKLSEVVPPRRDSGQHRSPPAAPDEKLPGQRE